MRDWRLLYASLFCFTLGATGIAVLVSSGCTDTPVPLRVDIAIIGMTGSMRPTFFGGEFRAVIHKPYEELQPGDVALTWFGGAWHPHRLVVKWLGRWTTRGDANWREDYYQMTPETYGGVVLP